MYLLVVMVGVDGEHWLATALCMTLFTWSSGAREADQVGGAVRGAPAHRVATFTDNHFRRLLSWSNMPPGEDVGKYLDSP